MPARSNKPDRSRETKPSRPSKPSAPPRRPSRLDIDPPAPTPDVRTSKKQTRAIESVIDEALPLPAPEQAHPLNDEHDAGEAATPKKNLRRLRRITQRDTESPKATTPRVTAENKPKMSLLDAAALLMSQLSPKELAAGVSATDLCDRIIEEGLWRSNGRTPHMSLYASMNKEHMYRGDDSRFERIGPNLFTAGPALKRGKRSTKPDDDRSTPPKSSIRSRGKKSTREGRGGEA